MDTEQLAAKRISRETGIPTQKLLMQPLTEPEEAKVSQAAKSLASLTFYSNEAPTVTVDDIGTWPAALADCGSSW